MHDAVVDGRGRRPHGQAGEEAAGCCDADYRTVAKNARTSSTNRSGCSNAAKCPPRGMVVQCVMLYAVSHQRRGVRRISLGKAATPVGSSTRPSVKKLLKLSQYSRADDAPLPGP